MKKRLIFALTLLLCAVLLAGCSGQKQKYDVLSAGNGGAAQTTQKPADVPTPDPLAEEDTGSLATKLPTQVPATPTPAPTVRSQYAGATPVVIDPIDKPTPTAVPKLQINAYAPYDAIKLGLAFEGPSGWIQDDSAANVFIIQHPPVRGLDCQATLILREDKVNRDYSADDLKAIVKDMLNSIKNTGFDSYSPTQTASRTLLGKNGVYADYSGTMEDGTKIAGRVHAVCVDRVIYTVHLYAPKAQWEDYKDTVYKKLRDTLVVTK